MIDSKSWFNIHYSSLTVYHSLPRTTLRYGPTDIRRVLSSSLCLNCLGSAQLRQYQLDNESAMFTDTSNIHKIVCGMWLVVASSSLRILTKQLNNNICKESGIDRMAYRTHQTSIKGVRRSEDVARGPRFAGSLSESIVGLEVHSSDLRSFTICSLMFSSSVLWREENEPDRAIQNSGTPRVRIYLDVHFNFPIHPIHAHQLQAGGNTVRLQIPQKIFRKISGSTGIRIDGMSDAFYSRNSVFPLCCNSFHQSPR